MPVASTMSGFDSARFRKCLALAVGGATEGERLAGQAAAARVAVAAGLSFEEAERRARLPAEPGDDFVDELAEALARSIAEAIAQAFKGVHEEIARQMAARDQQRREEARERRRQEKAARTPTQEWDDWAERAKAEQAERDRLWAEQRARARAAETIGASA